MTIKNLTPDNISIRSKRSKVYIDPDTEHFGDVLAGWAIGSDEMSKGSVKIQATNERILLGSATEPLTGVGIFIGKDGTDYEFRVGDPDNNYIHWNGSDLTLVGNINSSVITGGTIQTSSETDVNRIIISGANNDIEYWSEDNAKVGQTKLIYATDSFLQISIGSAMIELSDGSSSHTLLYARRGEAEEIYFGVRTNVSNDAYIITDARIAGDWLPQNAETYGIGDSTYYWYNIDFKELRDRGCLGFFDEGVELQDGRIVSDIEALKSIQKHPTLETTYGVPRLDYKTMPKVVYKKADFKGKELPRDKDDKPYHIDEKTKKKVYAEDGAELTSLISIMIGAIKELSEKVESLEKLSK